MANEYEVISEFDCCGRIMVTVRSESAAYVMSQEEWRKVCGRNHQGRWKAKVDWNRFIPRKKYDQSKVS